MSLNDNNQQNNQNVDKNKSLKNNSRKSKKSKQKEQDKKYQGIRCLVANDNEFQLMVINHILQKCKFEILEAINGFDALEQVQKSKLPFDFIILDLDMPIMSGYEAADAIIQHHKTSQNVLAPQSNQLNKSKKDQSPRDNILNNKSLQGKSENQLLQQQLLKMMDKDIPILIALSSLVNDQVKQRCYDCGFDLVLEAPLSQEHIDLEIMPMVIKNRNIQNQLQQIQEE